MCHVSTAEAAIDAVNEVRLVGRVSQQPEERVLPSGDSVWTFRVVVPRPPGASRSRQQVDALECAVWSGRARRSVATWAVDDLVEVTGARPATVLPDRGRRRVAGRGGGGRCEGHPSRRERMSTPRLGLGWKEVAFSGSSRSPVTARRTRS